MITMWRPSGAPTDSSQACSLESVLIGNLDSANPFWRAKEFKRIGTVILRHLNSEPKFFFVS